jgi:hypothetical protein
VEKVTGDRLTAGLGLQFPVPGGPSPAVRTQKVFDVQWSDCPVRIEDEVRRMWVEYGLGNDHYLIKIAVGELTETGYPIIQEYLEAQGVRPEEEIWIHWWW